MGNLFIMAAAARFQSLHTATNAFLVSLAVADFLVAVLVMHFGCSFCRVHFMLDLTLCTSSVFNLSCVALDQ
ncbi:5-hydroxytryptamine receptor 4-like protein [Lates japonicus]|uniref:5-hydroxytryptamine receptor 4-like protein n=1 Tax=Lates japonicus TaxID=270547 RepID=A0AAD3RBG4_LATJO|nr:5-hydroxytryptamine receptor 4-like protein [Lates japonicus]